jgi:Short C-terminal domain
MFGPGRRVARRTARRTSRRQMYLQDSMSGGYDEPSYAAPPPAPAAPQQPDYLDELQKLGELKAAGVLNDEEFEAKKKQLLGI